MTKSAPDTIIRERIQETNVCHGRRKGKSMRDILDLNGRWELGICTDEQYRGLGEEIAGIHALRESGILVIDGTVPGNYELDMERSGLIPDPFLGKNLLLEHGREMNHLFYGRSFEASPEEGRTYLLTFDGIDTVAEIYVNGKKLAKVDNMLIGHTIPLTGEELKIGRNEVLVHIIPIAVEARGYDYPLLTCAQKFGADGLYIRKAPYMFGWDIFPRMLSGGIWRGVRLAVKPEAGFRQSYLFTRELAEDGSSCQLEYYYELELGSLPYLGFSVEVEGTCGESHFFEKADVWSKAGRIGFGLENPQLWWPRRSGEQRLYEVEARLVRDGQVYASQKFRTGIRTVFLERTSLTDENGSGEFCFIVNHKKTFILGTNWVPLDSFPSRGKERIRPSLELVADLNCNMIRCWGGGYYDDDELYDLCDEFGILVWQDFMQACARYPETASFLDKMEEETVFQIRRLRQHPCLALWSGDNENDQGFWYGTDGRVDPNTNRNTREVIRRAVRMNDYVRDYIPSSPYIDEAAYAAGSGDSMTPEQHLWGPRDYYKGDFYRNATAHFASETGYHGCPCTESIRKFITEDALWPYTDNGEWLLHASSPTDKPEEPYAYRIELMAKQIRVLFGGDAGDLEEFSLLSQISQAEAKKYFIERFRIGKWRRTGIIWWNVIDGCPQFSDAVVDYYFVKKLAYDYIKRSQEPVALMCDEPDGNASVRLMGVNDCAQAKRVRYRVTDVTTGTVVLESEVLLPGDSSVEIGLLDTRDRTAFFDMEWTADGRTCRNHYVTWEAPFDREEYVRCARKAGLVEQPRLCRQP